MSDKFEIRVGYVPINRDSFPVGPAAALRDQIRAKVDELAAAIPEVTIVDTGDLLTDKMLWDTADIPAIVEHFREQKVDALFILRQLVVPVHRLFFHAVGGPLLREEDEPAGPVLLGL